MKDVQIQSDTVLELCNVTKKYHGAPAPALSDISFKVKKGEFLSIIGPSGAGKSTLLRCINRMIEASSGQVLFQGVDICR